MVKNALLVVVLAIIVLLFALLIFTHVSATPNQTTASTSSIPSTSSIYPISTTSINPTVLASNSPIQIISVNMIFVQNAQLTSNPQQNTSMLGREFFFNVALKNTGNAPIFYGNGCGSPLYLGIANMIPSGSAMIVPNGAGSCAAAISPPRLNPNATVSLSAPNFAYVIVNRSGNLTVNFIFVWAKSNSSNAQTYNTTFSEKLNFH